MTGLLITHADCVLHCSGPVSILAAQNHSGGLSAYRFCMLTLFEYRLSPGGPSSCLNTPDGGKGSGFPQCGPVAD